MLYKSLVLLKGCHRWTLTADLERRIQAFENKCYRRMLGISYREHNINEYVWQQVNILARCQEPLLSTVESYHGSTMSVVMTRCRRSHYKEKWMVGVAEEDHVNYGRTTSRNGQPSRCHHCCTSRIQVLMGGRHNGGVCRSTPNNAWTSRELVS